jgi:internalin A
MKASLIVSIFPIATISLCLQSPEVKASRPAPQSFEKWCLQQDSLPSETKKTIDVLLKGAGTKDCKLANSKISKFIGLNLEKSGITDIRPLEGFSNLKALNLNNNYIRDITPLSSLTNLTVLGLSFTMSGGDITPLSNLTNLTVLGLGGNEITNVTALTSLKKLTFLDLSENELSDVSALKSLTQLTELHLRDNEIDDVCPVKPASVCVFY